MKNILNKFDRNLTPIKDYKTVYEYQGQKYIINTIEYIYLFLHTLLNISKVYQKYSSIIDSMYSDILQDRKTNFINYSQSITIEIKKNRNFKIYQESYKNKEFYVYGKYDFTDKYTDFVNDILESLLSDKKIKIYTLLCGIKYIQGLHSELIFFQIQENKLYIVNYDPSNDKDSYSTMRIFMDYLSKISEEYLEEKKINLEVKIIYKENLLFQFEDKKLGGLQRLTKNLYFLSDKHRPTGGLCLLYSFLWFIF